MINVLTYFIFKVTTLPIGEKGSRSGNNIIFILTTSIGILTKIKDKYTIHNQGKTIDSLKEEVKEKENLIRLQESTGENIKSIDEIIKYPKIQENLQQSKEFKEQMVVYQNNKSRVLDLDTTKSTLMDEGETIRRSLDNGEFVSEEIIKTYTSTVESTAQSIADELQSLNVYLSNFKDYVINILSNGSNNNFLWEIFTTVPNDVNMDMFVNYGGLILILWNLFAIFCTLSGNYIFNKFNGRNELLDNFIAYRRKFSKYLLFLDVFFTILIILLIAIYNYV